MGAGPTVEALIVHQPQEVPFSSELDEIPRLYRFPSGHQNERRADQDRT